MTKRMKQDVAYWMLKLALRLCRRAGYSNPRGLAMDAAGDIGWKSWDPRWTALDTPEDKS